MDNDKLISVRDVYNVIAEHMKALDKLWPDSDRYGPRKVHIVELIDAIKLRLVQKAEHNAAVGQNSFERAAERIVGKPAGAAHDPAANDSLGAAMSPEEKAAVGRLMSPMEEAHRAAKERMAKYGK